MATKMQNVVLSLRHWPGPEPFQDSRTSHDGTAAWPRRRGHRRSGLLARGVGQLTNHRDQHPPESCLHNLSPPAPVGANNGGGHCGPGAGSPRVPQRLPRSGPGRGRSANRTSPRRPRRTPQRSGPPPPARAAAGRGRGLRGSGTRRFRPHCLGRLGVDPGGRWRRNPGWGIQGGGGSQAST